MCVCRHAQDVRELYERKLERANNLYMELCACMLQMEKRERELAKSVTVFSSFIDCCSFTIHELKIVKNVKVKGQYICIAPYCRQPTSNVLRYSNAWSRDLTILPAHPRVYPRME